MLTEKQLKERRNYLGASDIPALLGISPYKNSNPFSLWEQKVNGTTFSIDPIASARGHAMETVMSLECQERYGVVCVPPRSGVTCKSGIPFIRATPDFYCSYEKMSKTDDSIRANPDFLLECKSVGQHKASDWNEGVPEYVLAQVQMQMYTTGCYEAKVACSINSGPAKFYKVEYSEELVKHIIELATTFWNYVEARTPLPKSFCGNVASDKVKEVKMLQDKIVELGNKEETNVLFAELAFINAEISKYTKRKKEITNSFKELIGENKGVKTDKWVALYDEIVKKPYKSEGGVSRRFSVKELK